MSPAIQENWEVEVRPTPLNLLSTGDIIVFRRGNNLIVHRLVGTIKYFGRNYFFLKGDNAPSIELIKKDKIIGKVVNIFKDQKQCVNDFNKNTMRYPKIGFCILYFLLLKLKRKLLGIKRFKFTSELAILYWKTVNKTAKR
mgnify:CR=1 FL=1